MRASRCLAYGPATSVAVVEVPDPVPSAGQVAAASLQIVDPAVDLNTAAASGVAHCTAYHALRSLARVVATAPSTQKLDLCRERGAEAGVNYSTEDLKVRLKEITGGGAECGAGPGGRVGRRTGPSGPALGREVRHLGVRLRGDRIPLSLVLLKGVQITGFTMEGFARHQPADRERDLAELAELARAGRATPYTSATYPLDEVGRALSELSERRATGKVLVDPNR